MVEFDEVDLTDFHGAAQSGSGYHFRNFAFSGWDGQDYAKLPIAAHGHLVASNSIWEQGSRGLPSSERDRALMAIYNEFFR